MPRRASGAAPDAATLAGVLRPWPAVLVTWGPGLHAHHCWHLVLGLDADLAVTTREGGRPRRGSAVLCAPDAPHAEAPPPSP